MYFPDSYFEDEVRDGFYVNGMTKRCWAAQLEVLSEIDAVCRRHGIKWFATGGTLIGAVRHGGFIPWDDDIDIIMLREDYQKFNQVAPSELPAGYGVHNIYSDNSPDNPITGVFNSNRINTDDAWLEKYHGVPFPMGIDIFVADYLAPTEEEENARIYMDGMISRALNAIKEHGEDSDEAQEAVHDVESVCNVSFDRHKDVARQLGQLFDKLSMIFTPGLSDDIEPSDKVAEIIFWITTGRYEYKTKYFEHSVNMAFENTVLPVSTMYDGILRNVYGNYMNCSMSGAKHGYPCFEEYEQLFMEKADHYQFRYDFTEEDVRHEIRAVAKPPEEIKEAVFLVHKPQMWRFVEPIVEDLKEKNVSVTVIPIPYYYRKGMGEAKSMCFDTEGYPDNVILTNREDYDIEAHHPDMIFIQDPFDSVNYTTCIHPDFYSYKLKKMTDRLIYVQSFEVDEIIPGNEKQEYSAGHFIRTPGVVNADLVVVPSECMRKTYIRMLTEYAGENTKHIWEEKIKSPKEWRPAEEMCDTELPEDWKKVIMKADGSGKRTVMYFISMSTVMEFREKAIEHIRSSLERFRNESSDTALILVIEKYLWEALKYDEDTDEAFRKLIDEYVKEGWGILADYNELETAINVSDEYYGHRGQPAVRFTRVGKAVTIEEFE